MFCEYGPIAYKISLFKEAKKNAKDEDGIFYRNSKVYRIITNKETKEEIKKELILDNHSQYFAGMEKI